MPRLWTSLSFNYQFIDRYVHARAYLTTVTLTTLRTISVWTMKLVIRGVSFYYVSCGNLGLGGPDDQGSQHRVGWEIHENDCEGMARIGITHWSGRQ